MKRMLGALLLSTLVLGACSSGISRPPAVDEPCGYQWAYKELPELSSRLQEEIKIIHPEATARATAFGEDCVYADGRADFLAMETDFHVALPAADLADLESLGDQMAQVMPVVEAMPPDLLVGPQAGFVEFRFTKNEEEFLIVRVPLQQYRDATAGNTGEQLFRMFYIEP